jgi:flagellar hook protein FlgE
MTTSFYNGVGGMKASQVGIDVLADNIANVNTTGFKQNLTDFSTLFSTSLNNGINPVTSDIGYAATVTDSVMDLSQGSIAKTDNVFDLAVSGKGWFTVKDQNGATYYTRTGSFTKDANGTLVDDNGNKLQVVNANNLTFDGKEWKYDAAVPTTDLVNSSSTLSSIDLPDNIVFPAEATTKIKIGGNLPNEDIAPDPKPAVNNSDFGVLYDRNAQNMNMKNGEDVVFGFGDNVSYSNGLTRYFMCVPDDTVDGEPFNVDFDVNGENIKLTLPDGSTSKEITDAVAKALDEKNILYDKTDNSITIKDQNGIKIKNNGGDLITSNSDIQRLVYQSDDNTGNNFTTMKDFMDKLQTMADFTYPNDATVTLDDKGQIFINNTTDSKELNTSSFATDNSNDLFINNLGHLGSIIKPNTSSNSLAFNQDYQGFTGSIIDANGNNNDLKFDFYKTKIDGDNTTWNMTITELDPDGNVISTFNQDLKFDNTGGLISPNPATITIDNNGTSTTIDLGGNFTGITAIDKANTGFVYTKNGLINGYLKGYDVDSNGQILAAFSNGKTGVLGQIPLFHFQNEQGLDNVGGNRYTPTNNSGNAFLYQDPNGKYIAGANIDNYSLEMSNVNLAQAMTEIIVTQKAFDANSKSITTSDQMIQRAIDMKR